MRCGLHSAAAVRNSLPVVAILFQFFNPIDMFGFYSNRLGCAGSLIVSLIGTALLILLMKSCNS
jgi:hypothetical protein